MIHRRFVGIVIRQTQVIHLIGQLIDLEDDAVVIDTGQRKRADVFGNGAAHVEQARIVHVRGLASALFSSAAALVTS